MKTIDRYRGALLGLAAGDRIGGPLEMAKRVARSLVACGAFDREEILDRYLDWHRDGSYDTGPVAERVFQLVSAGDTAEEVVKRVHEEFAQQTAGCNPAHRAAPLAMAAFIADEELAECVRQEATLTHLHPLAGDISAAVTILCRQLVRGKSWEDALRIAGQGRLPETVEALAARENLPLSRGGFSPEVLRAAVHFVGRSDSFDEALTASLQFAGPANYCPVLVGAIAGARWGAEEIPERHLRHCGQDQGLRDLAGLLAQGWKDLGFCVLG